MKNGRTRIWSMITAAAMIVSILPTAVFAVGGNQSGGLPEPQGGTIALSENYTAAAGDAVAPNGFILDTGSGTREDPYVISDLAELERFRDEVNGGMNFAGQYITLGADITLDSGSWTPIGSQAAPFAGIFDGGEHTVAGLTIADASGYTGFFGYLSDASVKNLRIENAAITCAADAWVGVLAGRADGSAIENCHVSGMIRTDGAAGGGQSGSHGVAAAGVVEYVYRSTIAQTSSAVAIDVASGDEIAYVGGIACEVNGSVIRDCVNSGDVSGYSAYGSGYSYVGGIAAYIKNGNTVTGCANSGTVQSGDSGAAYAAAGGILGQIWYENQAVEQVTACTNTGTVIARTAGSDSYAGGVVGEIYQYDPATWAADTRSQVSVTGCANTGSVAGTVTGGILAWGDVEWKLVLSDNRYEGWQAGQFGAPAEITLGGADSEYPYQDNVGWLHVFQVLHLEGTFAVDESLTIVPGQVLILEPGVAVEGEITIQPGGQLIVEDGAEADAVTTEGGSYLLTFVDGSETLGQIATDTDGAVNLPETPSKAGYRFDGWFTEGGAQISAGAVVTEHMTLNARWSVISSGGSSVPTYPSIVEQTENGTVTASPKNASKGATVTITVTPDESYALDTITVTDKDGKAVELTKVSDTRYTFQMPGSAVTVKAAFVKIGTPPFTDVAADAWYYDAVSYVYENGMMTGTNDGTTFSPAMNLTRGMMAQVLYNIEKGTAGTAGTFTDVAADAWYADAVNWAAANGIVGGYGDGTFGPEDSITREQMAVLLYNYAKFKGNDVTATADLTVFSDDEQVSDWAAYAMQWAVAEKLIQGSNNALNPLGTASRAEVAQILMNFEITVKK